MSDFSRRKLDRLRLEHKPRPIKKQQRRRLSRLKRLRLTRW